MFKPKRLKSPGAKRRERKKLMWIAGGAVGAIVASVTGFSAYQFLKADLHEQRCYSTSELAAVFDNPEYSKRVLDSFDQEGLIEEVRLRGFDPNSYMGEIEDLSSKLRAALRSDVIDGILVDPSRATLNDLLMEFYDDRSLYPGRDALRNEAVDDEITKIYSDRPLTTHLPKIFYGMDSSRYLVFWSDSIYRHDLCNYFEVISELERQLRIIEDMKGITLEDGTQLSEEDIYRKGEEWLTDVRAAEQQLRDIGEAVEGKTEAVYTAQFVNIAGNRYVDAKNKLDDSNLSDEVTEALDRHYENNGITFKPLPGGVIELQIDQTQINLSAPDS
jgi:hypothetical protein